MLILFFGVFSNSQTFIILVLLVWEFKSKFIVGQLFLQFNFLNIFYLQFI
jgi:hypothetical protein